MAWTGRSEDSLQYCILSFHHVGAGELTQAVRPGNKHPYPMVISPALGSVYKGCSTVKVFLTELCGGMFRSTVTHDILGTAGVSA